MLAASAFASNQHFRPNLLRVLLRLEVLVESAILLFADRTVLQFELSFQAKMQRHELEISDSIRFGEWIDNFERF